MQVDLGPQPVARLTDLLRETEHAHGIYEKTIGHPDADWPAWYAQHIYDRLTESEEARSE